MPGDVPGWCSCAPRRCCYCRLRRRAGRSCSPFRSGAVRMEVPSARPNAQSCASRTGSFSLVVLQTYVIRFPLMWSAFAVRRPDACLLRVRGDVARKVFAGVAELHAVPRLHNVDEAAGAFHYPRRMFVVQERVEGARRICGLMCELMDVQSNDTVLDLMCGAGRSGDGGWLFGGGVRIRAGCSARRGWRFRRA